MKLTAAESQKLQAKADRWASYIERQQTAIQEDLKRLQDLYANGSLVRRGAIAQPQFTEAESYTVTRLPGGINLSRKRGPRVKDESPEAAAKREKRRQRRAARKTRQGQ